MAIPLSFHLFDPTPCGFPPPRVALLPTPGISPTKSPSPAGFRRLGTGRDQRQYARGRYALLDAYRCASVGPEGALLAPAYHCRTMLDPAVRLGAEIRLYPVDAELKPDLFSLAGLCASSPVPVRALLLTHYFGIPQDIEPIRAFCEEHGIALIEDCSHAYLTGDADHIGNQGRFVVTSPYKFFPSPDGGTLIAAKGEKLPPSPARSPGLIDELRGLAGLRRRARRPPRDLLDPRRIAGELAAYKAQPGQRASETLDARGIHSSMYDAACEGLASLRISRAIIAAASIDTVAHLRRANYAHWVEAITGLPNCKPLFPRLPAACVPYMFPLLIDKPESRFYALKHLGVPIWRWDEMAVSPCPVSSRYRLHLLHLPCHQSLRPDEMNWMTAAVNAVMCDQSLDQR